MQSQTVADLYHGHATAIGAHCSRLLGDSADATDAVHETFIRVLTRDVEHTSPDHAVRSLYRISTNVCIDVLRRRNVRFRALPELVAQASHHGRCDVAFDAVSYTHLTLPTILLV